ncbi:protein LLP homolog [Lingula anatina]|uniref:Protein LLP homolog n=1 Tax=Lingula anatina TaxID=7574 RepID=A0A1S3K3K1_LINAN|nr:protein LLP homolog [Lingula anatina]XP_013416841.1 protein LLP homolog [Lingula anatina]|eukprot:XP_013416840.1 protein LLP homolog [Lingula anatina]
MAKSLRSKWKRKMRAVKRVKNAPKELAKLKKILGTEAQKDVDMKELYTVTDASNIKKNKETTSGETMDIDQAPRKYDKKTMRDENGQYPVWMNKKAIKKVRARVKKAKNKKGKGRKLKW